MIGDRPECLGPGIEATFHTFLSPPPFTYFPILSIFYDLTSPLFVSFMDKVMEQSNASGAETDREMFSIAKEEHKECVSALENLRLELTSLLLPRCVVRRQRCKIKFLSLNDQLPTPLPQSVLCPNLDLLPEERPLSNLYKYFSLPEVEHIVTKVQNPDSCAPSNVHVRAGKRDETDSKNALLEVRSGTGGDEAAMFARDIFEMYRRFAELKGWQFEGLHCSAIDLGEREGRSTSNSAQRTTSRLHLCFCSSFSRRLVLYDALSDTFSRIVFQLMVVLKS